MGDPPRLAPPDDVAKFAASLDIKPLICRSSSHVWAALTSSVRQVEGHLHWTTDCDQCGTTRTVVYTADGYIVSRRYEYPEGYLLSGLGRVDRHSRALMRVEMFSRMVGD